MIKKPTKHYSQKVYLFVIYGSFIVVLLAIFFLFTYSHYRKNTLAKAMKDLENMCASVENSVEAQLHSLSTISMNFVYSNAVKSNFKEFSSFCQRSGTDPSMLAASREKALAIHDIMTAIIGARQSATDVRIYTMDGSAAGYWLLISSVDLKSLPWYEEAMEQNGHMVLTEPAVHQELPARGGSRGSQKFISLVRVFLDAAGQPEGIVEVIQDCDVIFSLATQLENQNPDSGVHIFHSSQALVYPYNRKAKEKGFHGLIKTYGIPENTSRLLKTDTGEKVLFTYRVIPDYGWTVILTKPEAAVYEPLRTFQMIFALIGAASILFTLLICFYISQRLTAPLQKLTAATGKITINRVLDENKVNLTSADSNIRELSQLCESIRDMYEKLRSTSQEVLLSQSEETRAKLQATQSLVNPHFLYNSLTNISVMAEEGMNEDIIRMCQALCDYFRYISSSGETLVPLEEEIFYTKRYLECMQLRFTDELEYSFDMGEDTRRVYIPKLILQPIVENSFKYAFDQQPPWILHISSYIQKDRWYLRVQDNGGHLKDEKKQELLDLYRGLDLNEELKSLQIGGMGLKNVYLRLKLLYGDKAVFEIENSLPQRTVFILGGPVYRSKEEYYEQHPPLSPGAGVSLPGRGR